MAAERMPAVDRVARAEEADKRVRQDLQTGAVADRPRVHLFQEALARSPRARTAADPIRAVHLDKVAAEMAEAPSDCKLRMHRARHRKMNDQAANRSALEQVEGLAAASVADKEVRVRPPLRNLKRHHRSRRGFSAMCQSHDPTLPRSSVKSPSNPSTRVSMPPQRATARPRRRVIERAQTPTTGRAAELQARPTRNLPKHGPRMAQEPRPTPTRRRAARQPHRTRPKTRPKRRVPQTTSQRATKRRTRVPQMRQPHRAILSHVRQQVRAQPTSRPQKTSRFPSSKSKH